MPSTPDHLSSVVPTQLSVVVADQGFFLIAKAFFALHRASGVSPRWLNVFWNQAFAMTVASAPKAPVSEDTLIDALRGCENLQQLLLLRDQLAKDPSNPQLFDWVCSLLAHRSVSRGLAARVLLQLHHHPLA